ncbi:hypothetical protein SARC_02787 [Sphaeroforma arctica JP610]|uniref:Mediator of RNA polymerase II transcription subunit 16 n=1 Tax=Sphaeroforma arctica JP610 TaxID=667725 RepID=A0A0L0G7I4_9EUKA|nr:hypothetical protein SARC_02787 [Sphaeroforma arctica JP610]KNC84997.1 hypothetical protein SARC_02787 [Sphaeroforma arctica JP610]|eukprot:XP_014158899.1 hypothetical protein SARC_02787 [Sphaeroforma arctica JP610]
MSAGETLAQGITVITTPHRSPIRWLAWDSTGYYLVSVDTYGQVCLWGMRDFNANDWDCLYQSDKKDNQEVLGLQWWTSGVRSVVRSTGADSSGKALKGTPSNANTLAGIPAFSTSYPSSAPNGPQVPLGKLAFSVVTSSGDMRVFYRESRSRAISVSTYRLAPVTSPRLTAVAIGFYEHGEVLVATTHTSRAVPSAHVTVYHVQIGFTASDDFPAKSGVSFNARASHQWDLYDGLKLEKDDEAQPSNPETRQRARSKNRNIPTNCVLSFSPTKRELYCALVVQGIANQNTSGEVDQPKTNGHDTSNGIGGVLDTSILAKDTIGDALLPSDTMHTDTYTDIPTLTHAHVHEHIPPSFSRQTSKNTLKHTNTSPLLSLETAKINARAYLLSWQLRPVTLSANPNSVFGTNNPKFLQNQKHWKISAQTSWDIGNSIEGACGGGRPETMEY